MLVKKYTAGETVTERTGGKRSLEIPSLLLPRAGLCPTTWSGSESHKDEGLPRWDLSQGCTTCLDKFLLQSHPDIEIEKTETSKRYSMFCV